MTQPSLFGDIDSGPTDRLFFALYPDAETATRIIALANRLRDAHGLTGKALNADRLHVTLIHIGDFVGKPQGIAAAAMQAAAKISAPPFEVTFDHAASFSGQPGHLPFVLRVGEENGALTRFRQALWTETIKAGVKPKSGAQFTPHVTLLYDDKSISAQIIDPVGWTAREFMLVHSLLGQTRHVPLGRFALRGSSGASDLGAGGD